MIQVEFLGPIGLEPIEIEAGSLKDVAKILQGIDSVNIWLDRCAVAVNDEMVKDLSKELKSGDRVSILPPVCGG
jgi:molybdopterin synthase sulfur carrier subunit